MEENKNELVEQFEELIADMSADELEKVHQYIELLLNKE